MTHEIAPKMASWGVSALTLHGRTRQQRYARTADWGYIERVAAAAPDLQLVGNGDVFSFTDFHSHLESGAWRSRAPCPDCQCTLFPAETSSDGPRAPRHAGLPARILMARADPLTAAGALSTCMIARGALIKPWLFTEIKESRHWDISAGERLDMLKRFASHGLEHWGSDDKGVETTRR